MSYDDRNDDRFRWDLVLDDDPDSGDDPDHWAR